MRTTKSANGITLKAYAGTTGVRPRPMGTSRPRGCEAPEAGAEAATATEAIATSAIMVS